jgi:hypothetical protein
VATGTATLNFGAAPGGNIAQVDVTGQAGVLSGSKIEAFLMASDSTADNSDYQHRILPIRLRCGNITAGTGFTIYAISDWTVSNTLLVEWVWV